MDSNKVLPELGVRELIEMHEAEDRTLVALTTFQTFIQEHKAVENDPELKAEAVTTVQSLQALAATLGQRVSG